VRASRDDAAFLRDGPAADQATRAEARDFCRWLQSAVKPVRPHWRYPDGGAPGADAAATTGGARNAVTGKPPIGDRYDASTVAHCESVLRGFYDFRLEAGTGPMVNPFPLTRHRRAGRADAHHNPMKPFAREPQRPVPAEGGGACSSVHPRRAVQRSRCTIRHASF